MAISVTINLGTVGGSITNVTLQECTGNDTGCTDITGYTNVAVSSFPLTVTTIDNASTYIKVIALGDCTSTENIAISGITPTLTPFQFTIDNGVTGGTALLLFTDYNGNDAVLTYNDTDTLALTSAVSQASLTMDAGVTTGQIAVNNTDTDFAGFTINSNNNFEISDITQWGTIQWKKLYFRYSNPNLIISDTAYPDLTRCTDLSYCFGYLSNFNDSNVNGWDVSNVNNMSGMFRFANSFNQDLSYWNTSNVTTMSQMFENATNFNNGGVSLNNWNTANVTNMFFMFASAIAFNQNVGNWNVSSVTTMKSMLQYASSFNQDISSWNVSSVIDFENMFFNSTNFNNGGSIGTSINPLTWTSGTGTSAATDMRQMFYGCVYFNQDISTWNVSNVTDMYQMFTGASSFNQNINSWNVSIGPIMEGMFANATSFNQPLNSWDVSSVIYMGSMFSNADSFNQPLNNWDTANVGLMSFMFTGTVSFNQDISNWNVGNISNLSYMFQDATAFNNGGTALTWTTIGAAANVNMRNMFKGATSFNQDLSSWNTSNVTNMRDMFNGALVFDQDLSSWGVGNVTDMTNLFNNSGMSSTNYGLFLERCYALATTTGVKSNVPLGAGTIQYPANASTARAYLVGTKGWTITDGGPV